MPNQLDAAAIEQLINEIWDAEINKLLIWYTLPRPELRLLDYEYPQQIINLLSYTDSLFFSFRGNSYKEVNQALSLGSVYIYGRVIFSQWSNGLLLCGLGKRLVNNSDPLDLTTAINKTAELLKTYPLT